MRPYYEDDAVTIYHGDALEVLPTITSSTVDAVVTDPPYVIGAVSAGNMASKSGGWGRWAWLLDNVHPLTEPYPTKGGQGLRRVPDDIAREIERCAS